MTDDTEKPYMGTRGPRKTKPRSLRLEEGRENQENVRQLFGEEAAIAAKESGGSRGGGRVKGLTPKQRRRGKVRVGVGFTKMMDKMMAADMTMAEFCAELTPEELVRGQLKDKNGNFAGAPPKWVPAEFHKECIRELMRRGKQMYQENYLEAIQTMLTIANNPAVEPAQRIKAAEFVIIRIEGKVPEKLELGVSEPWQELLTGIVATLPASGQAPIRIIDHGGGS